MSFTGRSPCDHGVMQSTKATPPPSPSARRWTLFAAILGSSMAFMDGTVVNVALPAIQRNFNATASDAQWVIESYALFLSALLLVGGALGDRFGRRRLFIIGATLFALSSAACAISGSAVQLICTRSIQGIGAAMLIPGSLALISAAYPPAERGRAIGTWSAFSAITAAIGPVIGGFIVQHYSWNWAFLLNLPLSAVLLFVCVWKLPRDPGHPGREPVDIPGAVLATTALAGIIFALIEGPARGWTTPAVWMPAVAGTSAAALFLVVEARSRFPMLPLALFRERSFAGANLLTFMLYAALGGSLFFLPLNLIQVQGYSATEAGAAFLPLITIMFVLSRWTGGLVERVGARIPLIIGPAIAALGFALFGIPAISPNYWQTFFPAICVLGLGMSITVAPLTTTVMNAVAAELSGTASGINNAISRAGGLLAIALFGIVLITVFNERLDAELGRLHPGHGVLVSVLAQRSKLAGIILPTDLAAGDALALKQAIGRSFVAGFRWVMGISALLGLCSAAVAWWLIDARAMAALTSRRSRQRSER